MDSNTCPNCWNKYKEKRVMRMKAIREVGEPLTVYCPKCNYEMRV